MYEILTGRGLGYLNLPKITRITNVSPEMAVFANVKTNEKVSPIYCRSCEIFGEIRANYGDLTDDESLVRFFKEVLDKRDSLDEADKQIRAT